MQSTTTSRGIAARVGGWSARHKKSVLAGWLLFVILSVVIGGAVGTAKLSNADQSNGESGRADKALEKHFPVKAHESALIHSTRFTTGDPQFKAVVADVAKRLGAVPVVTAVDQPRDAHSGLISRSRHDAMVQFQIKGDPETAADRLTPVEDAFTAAQKAHPQFRIEEFGDASIGAQINDSINNDLHKAETLSLPITLLILIFAFGALVAAGVPVLLAISSVIATVGLVAIPSHLFPVSDPTAIVVTLIGMAVGVDYSLFYLKRQREERLAGHSEQDSIAIASATSGRAILISGLTVMVAMAGQFLTGDPVSASFGVGTIMVVAVAMLGSLTALPAMLALLGRHVDKGRVRIPFVGSRRPRRARSRVWEAVLDRVLARPVVSVVASAVLLLAIASPALHMRIHASGPDDLPPSIPGMTVLHHLQSAFPNSEIPAVVVVQASDTSAPRVKSAVSEMTSRALATGEMHRPITTSTNATHTVTTVSMVLAGHGTDHASNHALSTLRNRIIPRTVGAVPGVTANVTGTTAENADSSAMVSKAAPIVFAFVLSLAFVLLMVTFRSIVIPVKAIILNLLSVGAAYGVMVAVFEDGHFSSALDFNRTGGIAPWIPLLLFVILFGLSMDYHVFILSRVKELVDRGMTTEQAVTEGIKSTAGAVTSAAVVMVAVFSIFATLSMVDFKEFGVGMSTAILIDATIIRAVMLPASMKLLGEWNWYLPRPLQWLPHFRHEVGPAPAPVSEAGD